MTARPPTPPELRRGEHAATPASFGTIAVAGRYRLDAVHGQGSSATVYRATDLRLDRPVTVKLFDPRVAADPSLRARFRRQTAKASRLAHPHVAEILDGGFATELGDGERPFVVTEPAGPWSLRELLDRKGRLPPRQAVELAHQLASALSHAHRQGTVHTDVKPENVLVDEGGGHAKLVDFSLSFVSDRTGAMTRETIALPGARAGPRRAGWRDNRCLRSGGPALRDAGGAAALRRCYAGGDGRAPGVRARPPGRCL